MERTIFASTIAKFNPTQVLGPNPNGKNDTGLFYVKGRDYDPDRERAETKKLRKRLKQEAKGAVRELRKDNFFLLEVKERDKVRMEEEKAEKYGKFRAFLQEQEQAFKSGQLGGNKKKRRR